MYFQIKKKAVLFYLLSFLLFVSLEIACFHIQVYEHEKICIGGLKDGYAII